MGVRKYDGPHVTPVRHQPGKSAECPLPLHQGGPHGRNCCNFCVVLVSGGREGFAMRTEPASTFLMSFKRVEQGEQALGSQVEQLSADLAATKALLDKLAIRNSILP